MKLSFLKPNDPRLARAAKAVPPEAIPSPELDRDLEALYSVAYPEQGNRSKPILVGLAASQVGIMKRIVLVDTAADGHGGIGNLRTYINPVITGQSDETEEWYEGCYSTAQICGITSRWKRITIEAYQPNGQRITEEHGGYIARIFQHEIDHLNGKVFIDRITNAADLHWVEDGDFPSYRDHEGWRTWPHKCPRSRWEEIKHTPAG